MMVVLAVAGGVAVSAAPPADAPVSAVTVEAEPILPLPPVPSLDPGAVALGRSLFADTRLSADNATSCLSCHDLASNGATARVTDPVAGATDPLAGVVNPARNTPTVFNAALDFRLNWSGNTRTLEEQTAQSMRMALRQEAAVAARKLSADPGLVARFKAVYGRGPDPDAIFGALAAFQRMLLTPRSPFDRWLEGDGTALSADAREGYARFKAIGCVSCHQGVNVGGNLFQQSGVYRVLTDPSRPVLRVPSLRNVAATAPYFHDGSIATLPDAVRLMAEAQLGQTVSDETVGLIVAFLNSLTGEYDGHAVRPPSSVR